jgi:hypothetical protein
MSATKLASPRMCLLAAISIGACLLTPPCGLASTTTTNKASGYAIFSPDLITKLPSLQSTPLGASTIKKANSFLSTDPKPMSRLHVRHLNESTAFHDQSNRAQQDWEAMLYLGLAYRISGEKQYLDADTRYFGAWAGVFKPGFADLDPIDQAETEQLFMAYDLVNDTLPTPISTEMDTLCRSLAEGYMYWATKSGQDGNLQSHAVELAMLAAFETSDADIEKSVAKLFLKQISKTIQKDGSVTDWKARDALLYVDFNLKPLATGAYSGHVHGFDWFHTGGKKSIAHAVEWLIPYANGTLQHQEFIHTTLGFDHHRKEWGVMWKPSKNSQDILGLAALMDTAFEAPFQQCMKVATYQPGILVRILSALQPQAAQ